MTRRTLLRILAAAWPALRSRNTLVQPRALQQTLEKIHPGPFQGTRESLQGYEIPQWFRDAKFGIWAHWGPQSAAEAGDWYARNMYIQGEWQYKRHLEQYGHPSKFGFKDVIQTWKGDKFEPDELVGLYKKAGAKYFVSMGVHHDNFDLWNSRYTRWNAVKMGPRRDIVADFRKAARRHGLRFGVSDHLWISYKWFAVSHLSDQEGALKGVPYDGADPHDSDLYHSYADSRLLTDKLDWNEDGIPERWKEHWFLRIRDLVDQHHPDLLYADGHIPFQEHGLRLVAHLYNLSEDPHGKGTEAVFTSKRPDDSARGMCVLDHERGVVDKIWPAPWQTDTCIGNWHYQRGITYKTPKRIIDLLVDIVSRNGNLLLNFPLPNSGMLDDQELKILEEITKWLEVNGEAIYATRPWKIFGNEPLRSSGETSDANFNENNRKDLMADDVRFTTKGNMLYAFVMGWPNQQALIAPLAFPGKLDVGKVGKVDLLGYAGTLQWVQDASGLKILLPLQKPCDHAVAFRIAGIDLKAS
jgi:alpha-L-fucosidase